MARRCSSPAAWCWAPRGRVFTTCLAMHGPGIGGYMNGFIRDIGGYMKVFLHSRNYDGPRFLEVYSWPSFLQCTRAVVRFNFQICVSMNRSLLSTSTTSSVVKRSGITPHTHTNFELTSHVKTSLLKQCHIAQWVGGAWRHVDGVSAANRGWGLCTATSRVATQ
jgi:hypothetical protein